MIKKILGSVFAILFSCIITYAGEGVIQRVLTGNSISKGKSIRLSEAYGIPDGSIKNYYTQVSLVYGRENRGDLVTQTNWSFKVIYQLIYRNAQNVFVDSLSAPDTLEIIFNKTNPKYQELKVYDSPSSNYPKVELKIVKVDSISSGQIPDDIRLELNMVTTYQHLLGTTFELGRTDTLLYWSYLHGAKYYQLEWVFIDSLDEGSSAIVTAANAFAYKRGVRITTADQHYALKLTYPSGRLFYRVRGVGEFLQSTTEKFSGWQYGSSPITVYGNAGTRTPFEKRKNWQYSVSYSENGKSHKEIAYVDGLAKNRQTISFSYGDTIVDIAENKYDYEGRNTISIIPVPVKGTDLSYHKNFNQFETPSRGKNSYDNNDQSGAEKLSNLYGTSKYYSPNNNLEVLSRNYLPDAEGYPYSQIEYLRDGTGRLSRVAGVGKEFHIHNDAAKEIHYSRYFYGNTNDTELRRLFGSNVGNASHYSKQMSVNGDGQISVIYLDMKGRKIATALAGDTTKNHYKINDWENEALKVSLNGNNTYDPVAKKSTTTAEIMNVITPTSYKFKYDLQGTINRLVGYDTSLCLDCKYDLSITVKDPDGFNVMGTPVVHKNIQPAQVVCGDTIFNFAIPDINLTFNKIGTYKVTKELTLAEDSIEKKLLTLIYSSPELPSIDTIRKHLTDSLDLSVCDFTCEQQCRTRVLINNPGISGQELEDSVAARVQVECGALMDMYYTRAIEMGCTSILEQMIEQVSPNGHYYNATDMPAIYSRANAKTGSIWTDEDGNTIANPGSATAVLNSNSFVRSWGYNLAKGHIEYCHYESCISSAEQNSRRFDLRMSVVPDWKAAKVLGYTNPTSADPFFIANSAYATTMNNWLYNYANEIGLTGFALPDSNSNGTTIDLWDFVNSSVPYGKGTSYVPNNTEKWRLFFSIYLNKKIELWSNYKSSVLSCNYQTGEYAVVENPVIPQNANNIKTQVIQGMLTTCSGLSAENIKRWMADLENNCGNIGTTDSLYIAQQLATYCSSVCGPSNPFAIIIKGTIDGYPPLINAQTRLNTLFSGNACQINDVLAVESPYVYTMYNDTLRITGFSTCPQQNSSDLPGYGIQLQTNSGFNGPHGWYGAYNRNQPPSTYDNVIANSKATIDSWDAAIYSSVMLQKGKTYKVDFDVLDIQCYTGGPASLRVKEYGPLGPGGGDRLLYTGNSLGHQSFEFVADKNGLLIYTGECTVSIDSFTVREKIYCPEDSSGNCCTELFTQTTPWTTLRQECLDNLTAVVNYEATEIFEDSVEAIVNEQIASFRNKCFTDPFEENFSYEFIQTEYHYTLYYYDQADNLVMTVPPAGTNPLPTTAFDAQGKWNGTNPQHYLLSKNKYDSGGSLIWYTTPDAGEVYYVYDRKGRIRLSQNAKQRGKSVSAANVYSYSKYDNLGRTIEYGELQNYAANYITLTDTLNLVNIFTLLDDPTFPANTYVKRDVTETIYSDGDSWQENTRNALVRESRKSNGIIAEASTLYSYDMAGGIKQIRQEMKDFSTKTIDYEYDIISGDIQSVTYQKDAFDQYIHKYEYDLYNRMTGVYTSRDGFIWENDVEYFYTLKGDLARKEYGQDKVQGNDYYYTLQGWIKGMNIPEARYTNSKSYKQVQVDPGKDGVAQNSAGIHNYVGQDQYAYSLGYYQNDYKSINSAEYFGAAGTDNWNSSQLGGGIFDKGLYAGGVATMITQVHSLADVQTLTNQDHAGLRANAYRYDQLGRLVEARSYEYSSNTAKGVSWQTRSVQMNASYDANYLYDANGNIVSAGVNNKTGLVDKFLYKYDYYNDGTKDWLRSNRLYHVKDAASPSASQTDIDDQGNFTPNTSSAYNLTHSQLQINQANNYRYDELGSLIYDKSEQIDTIVWNVYGKVDRVVRASGSQKSNLEYRYDANGSRILKIVKPYNHLSPSDASYWQYTWYTRDQVGNLVATYYQTGGQIQGIEHTVYSSGKVGVHRTNASNGYVQNKKYARYPAAKLYEQSNHLGNVYIVLSGLKLGIDTGTVVAHSYISSTTDGKADYYTAANITSIQDYYPYGATIYERSYNATDYQFGFNGAMVKEGEYAEDIYFTGHRIYDARLGRWLSKDPVTSFSESGYMSMGGNPISQVDPEGDWVHIAVGFVIGVAIEGIKQAINKEPFTWKSAGKLVLAGATGAAMAAIPGMAVVTGAKHAYQAFAIAGGLSGAVAASSEAIEQTIEGKGYNGKKIVAKGIGGFILGGLAGVMSRSITKFSNLDEMQQKITDNIMAVGIDVPFGFADAFGYDVLDKKEDDKKKDGDGGGPNPNNGGTPEKSHDVPIFTQEGAYDLNEYEKGKKHEAKLRKLGKNAVMFEVKPRRGIRKGKNIYRIYIKHNSEKEREKWMKENPDSLIPDPVND